jgi:hypothetical protein
LYRLEVRAELGRPAQRDRKVKKEILEIKVRRDPLELLVQQAQQAQQELQVQLDLKDPPLLFLEMGLMVM